jgi:hypothetical protein
MAKRLKYPAKGAPVVIHWFDAHERVETGRAEELLETQCEVKDIGYYLGHKGKFVTIATEEMHTDVYRHVHSIPKVNIIRIEWLISAVPSGEKT